MKTISSLLFPFFLFLLPFKSFSQLKSWEGIHQPSIVSLENNFQSPPTEFASHVIWGWQGNMDLKTIQNDLDSIYKKGFRSVIFEAGYHMPFEYLSEDWFKTIAIAVKEAKKRNLKVWIIDEGKYPSGFAGGKFTRERPDLRMQALVVCDTIKVKAGDTLTDYEISPSVISAIAINKNGQSNRDVVLENGKITFNAGIHNWNILLVQPDFRTAVTRAVNNSKGGKDTRNSLCDYLNPSAVRQFIDWTHEEYKKYIGKEFGSTVLGFRGDEPDYAHMPWTPNIIEAFMHKKGYNPTPYLASLFVPIREEKDKRFRADYWDVWSELFANSFFKQQADWCDANGLAHITHLNNEHNMPVCVRAEGDFFRTLSKVQIPGVDAIWNQIWPETVNDFPKLASSVSHVYGKPRAFSESFAAYHISPTIPQAKYVVDHQIVRGINFFEFMFWMAGSQNPNWMSDPGMKDLNDYTNRATYLMSQGIPGARIAMYYPTSTMWLSNNDVFSHINVLTQNLLKNQYDFDYVNDDAFSEVLTVGAGYLKNKSGQKYYTLIIPSADAISISAWEKIEKFAKNGGKVLFWGKKPDMLIGTSFKQPYQFPLDFVNCSVEPSCDWTSTVAASMPNAEMKIVKTNLSNKDVSSQSELGKSIDFIRYTRRVLPDAEIYYLFNEGETDSQFTASFDKVGLVKEWNATTGEIKEIPYEVKNNKVFLSFNMKAWDSRIIIIQQQTEEYNITSFGAVGDGKTINTEAIQKTIDYAHQNGGGCVVIPKGEYLSGALFFRPGVDLQLKKKAVLKSTVRSEDFPIISTRFEGIERNWCCAFLNFDQCNGVKVYGDGIIDGQGVEWKSIPFGETGRPRMFCFTECNNGSITGLNLRNQASWGVHVLYTDGFSISDLNISAEHTIPSSDGLDIDSSSDIDIYRVYIDVNDDCISIKSGKDSDGHRVNRPSENIRIEDCHFAYGHGGVAMGSEISGGVRNVTISNCRMDADNWGPIRFKSQPSRGGLIENITFENITLHNTRSFLDVNMEWRMVGELPPRAEKLTQLKNVRVINVKGNVESVGSLRGFADAPFDSDSFYFENCKINAKKALTKVNADAVSFEGLEVNILE